jgi:hypothetical protein
MTRPLESRQATPRRSIAPFSLRRTLYAPLMLSFPVSLGLTCVVVIASAVGWLPGIVPVATGDTRWADALALVPQTFVVCVCACWLLFGLSLPLSGRRSDDN